MLCQHCGSEFGTPIQRRKHELVCAALANPSNRSHDTLDASALPPQLPLEREQTTGERQNAALMEAQSLQKEEAPLKQKTVKQAAAVKVKEDADRKAAAATAAEESVVLQDPTEGNTAVPEELQCAVCQNPAPNLCSTCRRVRYCSRAHQVLTMIDSRLLTD